MTYEGEEDVFEDKLIEVLNDHFGDENVHSQKILPSERILDIHVELEKGKDLAIEVEDNWESVYTGHGQVKGYASELDAVPVVAVPVGNVEMPEIMYMSISEPEVSIIQIPVE